MSEPIQSTLSERGARYGDFTGHAKIAQDLQDVMRSAQKISSENFIHAGFAWERLNMVQRQALTVIADKIARILNGDPNYDDNWRDIAGYATLAMERCAPTQRAEEAP